MVCLTFLAITVWLVRLNKNIVFLMIPMVFTSCVTLTAVCILLYKNIVSGNVALTVMPLILLAVAMRLILKAVAGPDAGGLRKCRMTGADDDQVADALERHAEDTLKMIAELRPRQGDNKELRLTLGDLEAMSHLGRYYSEKIRAAVDLTLFDSTGKAEQKTSAIEHLEEAMEHWKRYAAAYTRQNQQPVLYNRVGWVDIPGALLRKVEQDIEMAKGWQPGTLKGPVNHGADTPFRK